MCDQRKSLFAEGDILKATLATDSVIGALTSPYSPQSAYVLLHHGKLADRHHQHSTYRSHVSNSFAYNSHG